MADPAARIPASVRLRHFGGAVAVVLATLVLGGSVFVWSGFYDVAASQQHTWVTNRILAAVRDRSIRARSDDVTVPDLSDPGLIALGAEHYQGGCAFCHGVPGVGPSPVVGQMLPPPPDLTDALDDYSEADLYVIVRFGLKYTGMPAWPAVRREDEVWSVVAYLVHLNREGPDAWRRPIGDEEAGDSTGAMPEETEIPALNRCARCHGDATSAPVGSLVPSLGGQSRDYLLRALREYAAERRPSGIMEPVAQVIEPGEMEELADLYAAQEPGPLAPSGSPEAVARGRLIAERGRPEAGVPACAACHEGPASRRFGTLDGLSADYLEMQLRVWQAGLRDDTGYGLIMAQVARPLTSAQIEDLGAYYQTRASAQAAEAPAVAAEGP